MAMMRIEIEGYTEIDLCAESVTSLIIMKSSFQNQINKQEQLLRNRNKLNLPKLAEESVEELAAAKFNYAVVDYALSILQSKLSELTSETKLGVAE